MTDALLTDRQRREREFYEEFSKLNEPLEVCFDPISGKETRPWNSYWRAIEIARENFKSERQTLLDFGCGAGENSLIFSKIGYEVFGFDLSPSNVSIATGLAAKYGMTERTHFSVGAAEQMDYPDEFFDGVVGFDILHHINISQGLKECLRVLKPGGFAVFHEPTRVPIFDPLRETKFGRWLVPKESSLDRHITEDERKLSLDDFQIIRGLAPNFTREAFLLLSRLNRFTRSPTNMRPSLLEKMDYRIFKALPFLKRYGGITLMVLRKPR